MKFTYITAALILGAIPVAAQECPEGVQSCNIATVGDKNITAPQDIGDTVNPTYAPDSSHSTSGATNNTDVVSQGGAADATANGNTSSNNNASNANNSLSNQQFGNSSASVGDTNGTGIGEATIGDVLTTSGASSNAEGGSVGNVNTAGGSVGNLSSGSTSSANGGKQRQSANASGGSASQGQTANNNGNAQAVNVNNSTRVKHAAHSAYAAQLNGYGPDNYFGDTNPSGSFTAGMQTFGWGVTAARSKQSNACAVMMVGGQRAAAAYLARQDPMAHDALVAAGVVTTPSRLKAQQQAQDATIRSVTNSMPYRVCEVRHGKPYVVAKRGRSEEAVSACMANLGQQPAISSTVEREPAPTCPAGSTWDGKGCWMPRK